MAQYLFTFQSKNRLINNGLLKRFNAQCYGTETTLQGIREKRAEKFVELKNNRGTKEYDEFFLKYTPGEKPIKPVKPSKQVKTSKIKGVTKKTRMNSSKMNKTKKKWFKIF